MTHFLNIQIIRKLIQIYAGMSDILAYNHNSNFALNLLTEYLNTCSFEMHLSIEMKYILRKYLLI